MGSVLQDLPGQTCIYRPLPLELLKHTNQNDTFLCKSVLQQKIKQQNVRSGLMVCAWPCQKCDQRARKLKLVEILQLEGMAKYMQDGKWESCWNRKDLGLRKPKQALSCWGKRQGRRICSCVRLQAQIDENGSRITACDTYNTKKHWCTMISSE